MLVTHTDLNHKLYLWDDAQFGPPPAKLVVPPVARTISKNTDGLKFYWNPENGVPPTAVSIPPGLATIPVLFSSGEVRAIQTQYPNVLTPTPAQGTSPFTPVYELSPAMRSLLNKRLATQQAAQIASTSPGGSAGPITPKNLLTLLLLTAPAWGTLIYLRYAK